MMSGIHIRDLEVFGHGLFQDILTLMVVLKKETIKKADIEGYLKAKLKEIEKKGKVPKKSGERRQFGEPIGEPKPVDFTGMRVSEKYKIFKEKNPDSNMAIEEFIKEIRAGRVPCKNCKEKEKAKTK